MLANSPTELVGGKLSYSSSTVWGGGQTLQLFECSGGLWQTPLPYYGIRMVGVAAKLSILLVIYIYIYIDSRYPCNMTWG